jgi:hypothetical protein
LQSRAHAREGDVHPGCVEFVVELLEHLGCRDVDVGDGRALQDDPCTVAIARVSLATVIVVFGVLLVLSAR